MNTTRIKQSRRMKKKEWKIYHNIGVQQDAERFSLIDTVLDSEYDNFKKDSDETYAFSKSNLLRRLRNELKAK
jgi:hypothetical protein